MQTVFFERMLKWQITCSKHYPSHLTGRIRQTTQEKQRKRNQSQTKPE